MLSDTVSRLHLVMLNLHAMTTHQTPSLPTSDLLFTITQGNRCHSNMPLQSIPDPCIQGDQKCLMNRQREDIKDRTKVCDGVYS